MLFRQNNAMIVRMGFKPMGLMTALTKILKTGPIVCLKFGNGLVWGNSVSELVERWNFGMEIKQ